MKKLSALLVLLLFIAFPVKAEKWVFTEFGLNYGTVTGPQSRMLEGYGCLTPRFLMQKREYPYLNG